MRRLKIEVVTRTIEIDGEQEDRIEPILLTVGLGADEERLLGDAVGSVRLLRVAVPEVVFLERDRCELRIGADSPDRDKLAQAAQTALLERFAYQ